LELRFLLFLHLLQGFALLFHLLRLLSFALFFLALPNLALV